jgi:UTP--glucose-1-phosphate uridylyltransferase
VRHSPYVFWPIANLSRGAAPTQSQAGSLLPYVVMWPSITVMTEVALQRCLDKMADAGVSQPAMDNFSRNWRQCAAGSSGMIPETSIQPLLDPPQLSSMTIRPGDAEVAMQQAVLIKLNGGLGTSMGLDRAKTLLPVRDGLNFLDLIVAQVQHARRRYQARLPLLFMNSFRTRDDTLGYLQRYPDLAVDDLPLDFLQSAEPKVLASDLSPVEWPTDPSLEWCPPGHGDVYASLLGTGILDALIDAGFRYASIANGDNLGAAPNALLAGWFAASDAPYAAEICPRTINDRKGGHLAIRRSDGQLILRDTAQTPAEDMDFFTDEYRHPFFHTNNLWLNLPQLRDTLTERDGVLGLPLIANRKTVDPADKSTSEVIQLETAMGAAIEVFPGATAIAVGRDRFLPVKTTNELMLLRSDVFDLGDDGCLNAVAPIPEIDLDPAHYRLLQEFDRLVTVVPSLATARSLRVNGEWHFDEPATIVGEVDLPDSGSPQWFR